ncbi:hypothetical protein [Geomonas agri]|uniref:hypothetical protein n=1 Tax=Geomonas agri TaxID=2873702 RepID=UPI001CD449FD|nr:hypothetical protein [Geomonas agri]
MLRLKFDLKGRPSAVLANCKRYYNGLSGLSLYRNVPDQAIPLARIKEAIDDAEQKYQAAINFDRVQIVLRDKSFKELLELFKKIAGYLQLIATEENIPELLQAGVQIVTPFKKRKQSTPATT